MSSSEVDERDEDDDAYMSEEEGDDKESTDEEGVDRQIEEDEQCSEGGESGSSGEEEAKGEDAWEEPVRVGKGSKPYVKRPPGLADFWRRDKRRRKWDCLLCPPGSVSTIPVNSRAGVEKHVVILAACRIVKEC